MQSNTNSNNIDTTNILYIFSILLVLVALQS